MKRTLIITILAAAPALFAAETNALAPTLLTNATPILQVDLVEQARLVTEIGQEAAKGFDAETHARSLRAQIEALLTKSAVKPTAPTDPVENATTQPEPAAKPSAITAAATAISANANTSTTGTDPAVLKEAIRILRAKADELEAQLEKPVRKP